MYSSYKRLAVDRCDFYAQDYLINYNTNILLYDIIYRYIYISRSWYECSLFVS